MPDPTPAAPAAAPAAITVLPKKPLMNKDALTAFAVALAAALVPVVLPMLPPNVIGDLHNISIVFAAVGHALHLDGV
jgi:hypothetical protein